MTIPESLQIVHRSRLSKISGLHPLNNPFVYLLLGYLVILGQYLWLLHQSAPKSMEPLETKLVIGGQSFVILLPHLIPPIHHLDALRESLLYRILLRPNFK